MHSTKTRMNAQNEHPQHDEYLTEAVLRLWYLNLCTLKLAN